MLTSEQGAATTLHCATVTPSPALHGAYFDACQVAPTNRLADDAALAAELWRRSAAWTGLPGD
jgi:retinol dehydrogenase-12